MLLCDEPIRVPTLPADDVIEGWAMQGADGEKAAKASPGLNFCCVEIGAAAMPARLMLAHFNPPK